MTYLQRSQLVNRDWSNRKAYSLGAPHWSFWKHLADPGDYISSSAFVFTAPLCTGLSRISVRLNLLCFCLPHAPFTRSDHACVKLSIVTVLFIFVQGIRPMEFCSLMFF